LKLKNLKYLIILTTISIMFIMLPSEGAKIVQADSDMLKWNLVDTPGSVFGKNDLVSPSEVNRIAIGSDGKTFYAVDIANSNNITGGKALYKSTNAGISWSDETSQRLYRAMSPAEQVNFRVWNVAIAPDDINFVAVVTNNSISNLPQNIWLSTDGGSTWQNTDINGTSNISTIDIAKNNGDHVIVIGTRSGVGNGNVYMLQVPGTSGWTNQGFTGDIMALKLSPGYAQDASIVIVYSDANGTYLNVGIQDLDSQNTNWAAIYNPPPEITTSGTGSSPKVNQLISADLELPSDFSGQAPSFRRYYISVDALINTAGIYRFDDNAGYWLMPASVNTRIASIAYFGDYNFGKLLAGEVLGNPCSASVMTWFSDAPTTCPATCWYQSVKPPTGAAGTDNCTGSGYGNAQIFWASDGSTAYAGTASTATLVTGINWPNPYLNGENLDESSFSISQNNGQTWNQLSLIDTTITESSDIAPSPDCSTVYLASINNNTGCSGFDSVWRSKSVPIGSTWERILCKPTTDQPCAAGQTNTSILRLAGDTASGQYLFWAATGTRAILWSADHGDWWGKINPRFNVQDMAAEDSKTLYILNVNGQIQKLNYTGTGWTSSNTIDTGLDTGYSIATAYTGVTPDNYSGNIIVGGTGTGNFDVAYSTDGGLNFTIITKQLPTRDNTMVVASSSYYSDGYILAINSGGMYAWGIYSGITTDWETWWGGSSFPSPVTGLTVSRNYSFYFPTPASLWAPATPYIRWYAATANLDPNISLGTQPTTRFRICGGLETGEPIIVYAIDQRPYNPPTGGVWYYVDCMAWEGPLLTEPISLNPVDFDPVSGRADEINFKWEPLCLSRSYRIQIAKDTDFTLLIADIGSDWAGPFYTPPELDTPALIIPPGSGRITDTNGNVWTIPNLEAGHTYYWRVRVRNVATGDNIDSPWSWRESFIVKQGFRVTTPYYGPQLLAPSNGCGCSPDTPACFSWTPFKETNKYKLELSESPDLSHPLVSIEVPTTSYHYQGKLKPNTNYFWRVKAETPHPSEWSAAFSFMTQPERPSSVPPTTKIDTPVWVLVIIAIGGILAIVIIALIFRITSEE